MKLLLAISIVLGLINGIYYPGNWQITVVGLFIVFAIESMVQSNKKFRSMPTVNQYKAKTGSHINGGGMECKHCGSRSIRNWGRYSANDDERIFICNHCGKSLYRNG